MKKEKVMKSIIVFGAGNYGRKLAKMLDNADIKKSLNDLEIKYFVDNDRAKWGKYFCGKQVLCPAELKKYLKDIDGICISTPAIVDDIINQLHKLGVTIPVYMVPYYVYEFMWNKNDMPALVEIDISKPRLHNLSFALVTHCNLNCKGCAVLANIADKAWKTIEKFEQELIKLKELFSGIKIISLSGGEPLLHDDLKEFIKLARYYFPDAELTVLSNGLLIPKMRDELWHVMHKMDVHMSISLYPVTGAIKGKIEEILDSFGVKYSFTEPIYTFRRSIDKSGDWRPEEIFQYCPQCITLTEDGKLTCSIFTKAQKLEEMFQVEFPFNKEERCIDIYHTTMDGWQINKLLTAPSPICSYCSKFGGKKEAEFPWTCNNKEVKLSDWVF